MRHGSDYANWAWINIPRIFELIAKMLPLELSDIALLNKLKHQNIIDNKNLLKSENQWSTQSSGYYFLNFGDGFYVAHYLSLVVEHVFKRLPIIDITENISNISWLNSLIREGVYITTQLPFYFADHSASRIHKDIVRRAYYRGYGVKIEYTYQQWYCLSSSAMHSWMSGHHVQTIVGLVRSIERFEGELIINISCLAAGSHFKRHSVRN